MAALVALGLLCGYCSSGRLPDSEDLGGGHATLTARPGSAAWALLVVAAAIGCWRIFGGPFWARRWLVWPSLWLTTCPTYAGRALLYPAPLRLLKANDRAPFGWSLAAFFLAFLAIGVSLHPYVIPPALPVAEAAGPALDPGPDGEGDGREIMPLMLIYNGYQYLVFRGKAGGGYGDVVGERSGRFENRPRRQKGLGGTGFPACALSPAGGRCH